MRKFPEKINARTSSSRRSSEKRNVRLTQVTNVIDLTPHLRRIVFTGKGLYGFPAGEEGAHVKVVLPAAGEQKPVLDLGGKDKPVMRSYTIQKYDPLSNQLSLDFVVNRHQGPATNWAAQAKKGDYLGIAGPGVKKLTRFTAQAFLLVGDLTSINAVSAFAQSTPAEADVHVLLLVPGRDDVIKLDVGEHVSIQWLVEEESELSESVLKLAGQLPEDTQVFLGLEAAQVKKLTTVLQEQLNIDRSNIHTSSYWIRGKSA
ncbi:siderophore-interacting protein [Psychromonas aquimarina]|uniref:siderophore-interacting protein n=1 Tax=Psychromonas aquimarina TaxID=444919 RepID=UPI0003FA5E28|nr:siderophore-interacting protein [Psychromonas aquimarina]